jgi:hypothetical protein
MEALSARICGMPQYDFSEIDLQDDVLPPASVRFIQGGYVQEMLVLDNLCALMQCLNRHVDYYWPPLLSSLDDYASALSTGLLTAPRTKNQGGHLWP